ncbi:putative protein N(5)-glutamine methyltransferase [Arthrobacter sp. GMC3]|uniref:putative protein N(5)-glutamine methyltransferase n=1 Tax=Arthrobacter sp. GMC3 TaxID=2058894 RepID=UPI000CE4C8AE|nr:putative protein N(5)-glutamine methyltransferase [Arthrobacter sp. GMC3]
MEPHPILSPDTVVRTLRAAGCVYAEDEAAILSEAAQTPAELAAMMGQRVAGFPLEHIVGWAQFRGLRITVTPGVFVPRLRTELLVSKALEVLRSHQHGHTTEAEVAAGRDHSHRVVVDLCCGSGAVGAALAHEHSGLEMYAADIDPAAVACAGANLRSVNGHASCGDLFDAIPIILRGVVDVVVANAPYVPTQEIAFMPAEARLHEPDSALNGGADGLEIQRRIAAQARSWLRPGGSLLVETSMRQSALSARIMAAHGFAASISHSEELDGTVVTGRLGDRANTSQ